MAWHEKALALRGVAQLPAELPPGPGGASPTRTSQNANSAKIIILHRNGDHEAPRQLDSFSRADPALMVAVDRPALDTLLLALANISNSGRIIFHRGVYSSGMRAAENFSFFCATLGCSHTGRHHSGPVRSSDHPKPSSDSVIVGDVGVPGHLVSHGTLEGTRGGEYASLGCWTPGKKGGGGISVPGSEKLTLHPTSRPGRALGH